MSFSHFLLQHSTSTELLLLLFRHSLQIYVRYGSRLKRHIPQYAILLLDLQSLHCTGLCIAMDKPPDVPVYGAKQWQSDHNIVQALLSNNKMMRMQQRSLTKWSHTHGLSDKALRLPGTH